jgi:hypothetical protein
MPGAFDGGANQGQSAVRIWAEPDFFSEVLHRRALSQRHESKGALFHDNE